MIEIIICDFEEKIDCVVIMSKKSTSPENWTKLLNVMKSVHEQNKGASEEEVYQDVERAVAEL